MGALQAAIKWVSTIVGGLLTALSAIALYFIAVLFGEARKRKQLAPNVEAIGLGAIANFFDTLGIGSFAPSTAWLKLRKMAPDSYFPAILNAGHALPTVTQALIFISTVRVDPALLISCIAAAVIGAFVGEPIVVRSPVRVVQGVVGLALLIAAALYALQNLNLIPHRDVGALSLPLVLFAVAVVGHFVLGVLMMYGIGLYAPSLIFLSLLGLNPKAAFPIMMGACAFLMPAAGTRFVRSDRIDLRIVIGLAIGGIPAVYLAWRFFQDLPMTIIRWGVVIVVLYAALLLLRAAVSPDKAKQPVAATT
jgi:uncharacterized membrane protein YfcA